MSSPFKNELQRQARQLNPISANKRPRSRMLPSSREVLLARMLVRLWDRLGVIAAETQDEEDLWLYNEVKSICEPFVREAVSRETLGDDDGDAS